MDRSVWLSHGSWTVVSLVSKMVLKLNLKLNAGSGRNLAKSDINHMNETGGEMVMGPTA